MENQGLLNRVTAESEVESRAPLYKIVLLAAIGIIFSFFFGYLLKLTIMASQPWLLLFTFLAALGFLAIFLSGVFFGKYLWKSNLIIFLESAVLLAAFYDMLSWVIGVGVLINFLLLLAANHSGWQEMNNLLRISPWRIAKGVLPKAIFGLAIFVSIVYVGIIGLEGGNLFISQSTFEKMISSVLQTSIVQRFLPPEFDLSLTGEELFKNLAVNQINQDPQFKSLNEKLKDQVIIQTADTLEKKVSELIGAPFNPKVKIPEAIYMVLVEKFNQLPASVKDATPMIVAAIIFLTIIGFAWPIRWLAGVLAVLIYKICLAVGFSTIMMEGTDREIVILK